MSYFIAYKGPFKWKARNRWLYPTRAEAEQAIRDTQRNGTELSQKYQVYDADHEPGRSILASRNGFS